MQSFAFPLAFGENELLETIGALLPEGPLLAQPRLGDHEWLPLDRARSHTAGLPRANQATALEHADVFQKRWEGHVEWPCQLGDARRTLAEPAEHRPPRGIGQCVEDAGQLLGIVSHEDK